MSPKRQKTVTSKSSTPHSKHVTINDVSAPAPTKSEAETKSELKTSTDSTATLVEPGTVQVGNLESERQEAPSPDTKDPSQPTKKPKKGAKFLYALICLIFLGLVTAVIVIAYLATRPGDNTGKMERLDFPDPIYSKLTGLEISDAKLNESPTFCVQIPNGTTDGARPQAGLSEAAIVFEAIAERGITRFAAVFQNPSVSVIGPIRSLRPYYLDWDTPFDCTVVHAGGSDEALAAIRQGGQRNLDESNTYMWREQGSDRLWNNLFTSSRDLADFNTDHGYTTSNLRAFPRYNPEENQTIVNASRTCPEASESCAVSLISDIQINFGATPMYNTTYHYDAATNTYLRSYATGEPHLTYNCPSDLTRPNTANACGEAVQVAPSVVIAMVVNEQTMSDNYHESIQTIGSGSALVFQNGSVIEATWSKSSQRDQVIFRDTASNEIRLAPGQVWIAAVPQYGKIDYQTGELIIAE